MGAVKVSGSWPQVSPASHPHRPLGNSKGRLTFPKTAFIKSQGGSDYARSSHVSNPAPRIVARGMQSSGQTWSCDC